MKKVFISVLLSFLTAAALFFILPEAAGAQTIGEGGAIGGVNSARGDGVPANLFDGEGSIVGRVINLFLYIVGLISVIMLIYGGFRYVISGGQKEAITSAKNTILYAIVGLLIAIFAYAIISFVLGAALGLDGGTDI